MLNFAFSFILLLIVSAQSLCNAAPTIQDAAHPITMKKEVCEQYIGRNSKSIETLRKAIQSIDASLAENSAQIKKSHAEIITLRKKLLRLSASTAAKVKLVGIYGNTNNLYAGLKVNGITNNFTVGQEISPKIKVVAIESDAVTLSIEDRNVKLLVGNKIITRLAA